MLKPHKYLNLDTSVLIMAGYIIKIMIESREIQYSDLYSLVESEYGVAAYRQFMPAVNLLFLLGKLDYRIENDSLELIL